MLCIYVCTYIPFYCAVLETNESAQLSEINQLLQYVEKKFSDILIPEEVVNKQEFIGKGTCMHTWLDMYISKELCIHIHMHYVQPNIASNANFDG